MKCETNLNDINQNKITTFCGSTTKLNKETKFLVKFVAAFNFDT